MRVPRYVIAITDHDFHSLEPQQRLLADLDAELRYGGKCRTEQALIELARDADAVLNGYARITADVIAAWPKCKIISRYGTGTDNIDLEAATRAGIIVTNVAGYATEEVSDHALALLLALARKIVFCDRTVRRGAWSIEPARPLYSLRGRMLGLIGFGKIVQSLARKAAALGLAVQAYDPWIAPSTAELLDVRLVDLQYLLGTSDFISLHTPLNESTRHIIDAQALARVKPGAALINTARGGLVDVEALTASLRSGRLAGAALDVVETEPPPPDLPLLALDQVIVTPHVAFLSEESDLAIQTMPVAEVIRALRHEIPHSVVNAEVLKNTRLRLTVPKGAEP